VLILNSTVCLKKGILVNDVRKVLKFKFPNLCIFHAIHLLQTLGNVIFK